MELNVTSGGSLFNLRTPPSTSSSYGSPPPDVIPLRRWLDSWRGWGDVVTGVNAQGYDVELRQSAGARRPRGSVRGWTRGRHADTGAYGATLCVHDFRLDTPHAQERTAYGIWEAAMAARRLTVGQRALLLVYCTDHAIAACKGCGQAITLAGLFAHLWTVHPSTYDCPRCGADVADSIHQHLSSCSFIGEAASSRIRQIVAEVRETFIAPDDDSHARRELAPQRTESGLIRCAICRRGLSAASDIIIGEGHLMHPACAENQTVTTERRPA